MIENVAIPYGCYWSSPFARWQGQLAHLHSLSFAAYAGKHALAKRAIDPKTIDVGVLGTTIPQQGSFYGAPWLMSQLGAPQAPGPTIAQACATGARIMQVAATEVSSGMAGLVLAIAADRTSNGPQVYYPAPDGPGGSGSHENWVLDNFARDPQTQLSMVQTAENVAKRHGIDTAQQNDVVVRRYEQYEMATASGGAFLKRFMDLPFAVPSASMRKIVGTLDGDEGIHATSAAGLARLRPVLENGTVTHGGQTHPADGHAAIAVTTVKQAKALARDPSIAVRIVAFGQSRAEPAYMPEAPVPAAQAALRTSGLKPQDMKAIKTHNPFVLNDIVLARALGVDAMSFNNYGCSLVWGHPQAPTGLRAIIELIEELAQLGGGYGLFTGCAAGDSAMAVIVHVGDGSRT